MWVRNAKAIRDIAPGSGICSWVATTKALRQTGHKTGGRFFASVADLAKSAGVPIENLAGISISAMAHNLQALGAKIGVVSVVTSLKEILARGLLRRDGSVVLISVRCMRKGQEVGGHLVYAFYDTFGRLRFMDRTIGGKADETYRSLEEIVERYKGAGIDEFIPRAALPLYNVFVKSVAHETPMLILPIKAVVAEYVDQKPQAAKTTARR
jgi:hypothetical protein